MREFLFALALLLASASIVVGIAHWSTGWAFVSAGVLLAGVAWVVLSDTPEPTAVEDES